MSGHKYFLLTGRGRPVEVILTGLKVGTKIDVEGRIEMWIKGMVGLRPMRLKVLDEPPAK